MTLEMEERGRDTRILMVDRTTREEIMSQLNTLRLWYHWFILALAFLFGWQVAESLGWSL